MSPANRVLLMCVRFLEGRYHGVPEWPPPPTRLFQALVAGAVERGGVTVDGKAALEWLEALPEAHMIAAQATRGGQGFSNFVPNNDSDKHPPYSKKVSKSIKPRLFDAGIPLLYAWTFEDTEQDQQHARCICDIAERLYQLGRGVDMAWAWGEILGEEEAHARFARHTGPVYRLTPGGREHKLDCPLPGSLKSLEICHSATGNRFDRKVEAEGKKGKGKHPVFQTTQASLSAGCIQQPASPLLVRYTKSRSKGFICIPTTGESRFVSAWPSR